jgi:hypothetical protein
MDDMQHAGEDDFSVKTLTGCCDTCGQDFYNHILEDWKGNKFVCPVQSPVEVVTAYQRGFDDGFMRRGDGLTDELEAAKRVGAITMAGCIKHAERVELMLLMRCPACNSPRHQAYPETCSHEFHNAFIGEHMPSQSTSEAVKP